MTCRRLFSRQFILLLILVLFSGCFRRPAATIITGELHGENFWQGQVLLRGDVVLHEAASLTIAPGTQVLFLPPLAGEDRLTEHPYFPGSELIVRGRLKAAGSPQTPIIFRASEPAAGPGSWGGLNIEDSEQAVFSFCRFQQSDSAIHARRSWISVRHSWFEHNLVGIRFHDSDILIENNLLQNNQAAIRFHFGSPVICNNEIRDNQKGLFITSAPWGYRIENNSFIDNYPYQVSLGEGVMQDVELGNNYWSEGAGDLLEKRFYDGRLDEWLGVINYRPVLEQAAPGAGIRWNR